MYLIQRVAEVCDLKVVCSISLKWQMCDMIQTMYSAQANVFDTRSIDVLLFAKFTF